MLFFHSKCLILTHIFFFVLQFYSFHIHPNDYFMWSISWASYWISLPKSHVWQCHTIHINPFFSLLSPFFALFASFLPACIRALYQVTSFWKLVLQWNSFNTVLTHVIVHFFFFFCFSFLHHTRSLTMSRLFVSLCFLIIRKLFEHCSSSCSLTYT